MVFAGDTVIPNFDHLLRYTHCMHVKIVLKQNTRAHSNQFHFALTHGG